ncbi:type VI secretion system baseplate subunit TssE [Entomohabitans teleogrylli]|uniref:type VI secretion system baseplate subunit TssE n=1 Tax=Entomohabitans teleogrylli TaxID=1384589 RepID=UPI00073D78CF|nr:type VI secretion system baseplate subunit TssE [Entomohabitans teleogrylli]
MTGKSRSTRQGALRDPLRPVLLDLLTDNQPQHRQETRRQAQLSHSELRQQVLRDLQWLLNCASYESDHSLADLPRVQHSTLNYGIISLAGKRMSEIEWSDIRQSLGDAIQRFEPRILPGTLQVRCLSELGSLELHNILSIELAGQLWCEPFPIDFLFRSEMDLENGHVELRDVGNP